MNETPMDDPAEGGTALRGTSPTQPPAKLRLAGQSGNDKSCCSSDGQSRGSESRCRYNRPRQLLACRLFPFPNETSILPIWLGVLSLSPSVAQGERQAQAVHPHSRYRGCTATFHPSCERPRETCPTRRQQLSPSPYTYLIPNRCCPKHRHRF